MKGRIVNWNDDRGFGFIEPTTGGNQVFFHISDFARSGRRPSIGEAVEFRVASGRDGKLRAVGVRRAGASAVSGVLFTRRVAVSLLVVAVFAVLWMLVRRGVYPEAVFWIYAGASALAFVLYGLDKGAAKRGAQRVAESTLQGLALVGGWPGALLAQQVFRHKTRKTSFQVVFWMAVAVNCGVLWWGPEQLIAMFAA